MTKLLLSTAFILAASTAFALNDNSAAVSGSNNDLRYVDFYLRCALGERNWSVAIAGGEPPGEGELPGEAADVVKTWALVASGTMTAEELRRVLAEHGPPVTLNSFSPELAAAVWAMAALPTGQVRAELAPLWDRLRAGTLPVAELPGQRPCPRRPWPATGGGQCPGVGWPCWPPAGCWAPGSWSNSSSTRV